MAVTVRKHMTATGTSYEWLTYTDADLTACSASADPAAWVEANATVTETVAATGLITPGDQGATA